MQNRLIYTNLWLQEKSQIIYYFVNILSAIKMMCQAATVTFYREITLKGQECFRFFTTLLIATHTPFKLLCIHSEDMKKADIFISLPYFKYL